jgi:hypothetical protein
MTVARASQSVAEVIRKNAAPQAQASQTTAEVLRKNAAPRALVSQLAAEVIRRKLPDAKISQVVTEVIRKRLPDARIGQIVAEVLRTERTLTAAGSIRLSGSADLTLGMFLSATSNIALTSLAYLEKGTELPPASIPVAITGSAALLVESRFRSAQAVTVNGSAQLQKGIELNAIASIPVALRAGLKVHPEAVTGFFLLF